MYDGRDLLKVSVIVPTYNQSKSLQMTLESVLAQTYPNVEVVVVDDGSTDDTAAMMTRFAGKITFLQQAHQGVAAARVTGIQASTGVFLLFMGADDLMPPGKLMTQVQQLEAQPNLGLSYFRGQVLEGEPTQLIREVVSNDEKQLYSHQTALDLVLGGCPLIRRDCIQRGGLLEQWISPDSEWNPWKKIALAGYVIDPLDQKILVSELLRLFLRKLNQQDVRHAQRYFVEAIRLSSFTLEDPKAFINSVFDYAKSPEVDDPVAFAKLVMDNLPECGQDLNRFRSHILAGLSILKAFQSYRVGNMPQVRRNVITGLRNDPFLLKNRGVISIFGKSLFRHANKEFDAIRLVIEAVQKELGQPVDSWEMTSGGTLRNTYLVRSRGRPYILRLETAHPDSLRLDLVADVIERIRAVGMPVPAVLARQDSTSGDSGPAWSIEEWSSGYHFIPQNMLWRDVLSIAADLGRCLRRLHSIETTGFGPILSERLEAKYQSIEQWLDSEVLASCKTPARFPSEMLLRIEAACQFLRESSRGPSRLCHFDLHSWNILVEKDHLVAVIDWDSVRGGDPALDIVTFYFWIDDEQILNTLLEAYAPEPEDAATFRRRIMAGLVCYAAYLFNCDFGLRTLDAQAVHRQCLRWLTDNTLSSLPWLK